MPTEIQKLYFEIKILTKRSQGEQTATAPATGIFSPSSPRYFICMQIFKWNNAVPKTSSLHTWEKVNIRQIPGLIVVWKADSVCTKCNDTSKKKTQSLESKLIEKYVARNQHNVSPILPVFSPWGIRAEDVYDKKKHQCNKCSNYCVFCEPV